MWMERGCQQNDSLADGFKQTHPGILVLLQLRLPLAAQRRGLPPPLRANGRSAQAVLALEVLEKVAGELVVHEQRRRLINSCRGDVSGNVVVGCGCDQARGAWD